MGDTTVQLEPDLERRLQILAEKLGRSEAELIEQAIRDFLPRCELEQLRWEETLEALEQVERGEVIPGEAVHTWMRSWGSPDELPPPQVPKKK